MNAYPFGGRSFGDALLRAFLVGTVVGVAWLVALAWYWKIAIFIVAMFIVGLVVYGIDFYRERSEDSR